MSSSLAITDFDYLPKPAPHASIEEYLTYFRMGFNQAMVVKLSMRAYTNLCTVVVNYLTCCAALSDLDETAKGKLLHDEIESFLINHLKPIVQGAGVLQDEALLCYYAQQWFHYKAGIQRLDHVLKRFNELFVKRKRAEGLWDIYEVNMLARIQWQREFVQIIPKLSFVLSWIAQEHNVQLEDDDLCQGFLDSLVSLANGSDLPRESHEFYREHVVTPLVIAIEERCRSLYKKLISEASISDYAKEAQEFLQQTECLAERCLLASEKKELINKCQDVLVRQYAELMSDNYQGLFESNRTDELRHIYTLVARLPDALLSMLANFERYLGQRIQAANAKLEAGPLDPATYVDTLVTLYHENLDIAKCCSDGDFGFSATMDTLLRAFVNCNFVTETLSTNSPKLIVQYADTLLKQTVGCKDNTKAFDGIAILSKYANDKDIFRAFYSNRLLRRLIHDTSVSEEAEEYLISKLREVHGSDFTRRLERMITDVRISNDLTEIFKPQAKHAFAIKVFNVLSCRPAHAEDHFVVPIELQPMYQEFQRFYRVRHTGRSLRWLWNYSSHELTMNYLNEKHVLATSSYQTAILLLYNRHDSLSVTEIVQATGISKQMSLRVLTFLQSAQILIKREDHYDLNFGFKSNKIRLALNVAIENEAKDESASALDVAQEDRNYALQAAIVRVMKARKILPNNILTQEAISQVSRSFVPKVADIKKAIERLLDLEYITRLEGSTDTFVYMS